MKTEKEVIEKLIESANSLNEKLKYYNPSHKAYYATSKTSEMKRLSSEILTLVWLLKDED